MNTILVQLQRCALLVGTLALSGFNSPAEPVIIDKGQNYQVLENTRTYIDQDGKEAVVKSRYTELQLGLYYRDEQTGEWRESQELIQPHPQGAIADRGCYKVLFHNNLRSTGAVSIELPDG